MLKYALAVGVAIAFTATSASAQLFNNGPVVDGTGLSVLSLPATTFGFGSNATATVADNFSVAGAGWNVSSLDFYGYQTQAVPAAYTFTSATWSIISGTNVNTGAMVASGTTSLTNAGLVGYRVTETTLTNQQRAIFRLNADITDLLLGSGDYFLTWSLLGTGVSGPFVPPVVGSLGSGNALQSLSGGSFATLVEAGSQQGLDLPFTINGTRIAGAVPEPASWAMMIGGFGLVGGVLRRRARTSATVRFA